MSEGVDETKRDTSGAGRRPRRGDVVGHPRGRRRRRRRHRLRVRRVGDRAAAGREGLPGARARGRPALRGRRLRQDLVGHRATTCGHRSSGCYGIQRIHRLPDVMVLAGAGVGGGSLNYANTLYVPPTPFFRDPQWADITDWEAELAPHYETACRMLGVVTNPCHGAVEDVMQRNRRRPRGRCDRSARPRSASSSARPARRSTTPTSVAPGPQRTGLHRVRQLHGRMPGGRQEHARQELPRARREPRAS